MRRMAFLKTDNDNIQGIEVRYAPNIFHSTETTTIHTNMYIIFSRHYSEWFLTSTKALRNGAIVFLLSSRSKRSIDLVRPTQHHLVCLFSISFLFLSLLLRLCDIDFRAQYRDVFESRFYLFSIATQITLSFCIIAIQHRFNLATSTHKPIIVTVRLRLRSACVY